MMLITSVLFVAVLGYLVIGLLFAAVFLRTGVEQIDPAARSSGWGFRLIIVPGVAALWPWLVQKWRRGARPREPEVAGARVRKDSS